MSFMKHAASIKKKIKIKGFHGPFNSNHPRGRLRGLAVACWTTDHYDACSNLGVGISDGCFIFDFASLPLEVARPI